MGLGVKIPQDLEAKFSKLCPSHHSLLSFSPFFVQYIITDSNDSNK